MRSSGALLCGRGARAVPALWKNCTYVNKRYPHGVGKVGARDKDSGTQSLRSSAALFSTALREIQPRTALVLVARRAPKFLLTRSAFAARLDDFNDGGKEVSVNYMYPFSCDWPLSTRVNICA